MIALRVPVCLLLALLASQSGLAQSGTGVDAARQVRNFDLRQAPLTIPFRAGTQLPATCVTGEAFFLSTGAAGENLYICSSPGTWSVQGRALVLSSQGRDFLVERSAENKLRINGFCAVNAACKARVGGTTFDFTQPANATLTGGTGYAMFFLNADGQLVVSHNLLLTCDSGCVALEEPTPQVPTGAIPLFSWIATSGTWDTNGGVDLRAFLSAGPELLVGPGLLLTRTSTFNRVTLDSTVVPAHLTANSTLTFPAIPAQLCRQQTLTVPGASVGDAVAGGWPADLDVNLAGTMIVVATDTIAVRLCNTTSSAITIPALDFRATIVRSL